MLIWFLNFLTVSYLVGCSNISFKSKLQEKNPGNFDDIRENYSKIQQEIKKSIKISEISIDNFKKESIDIILENCKNKGYGRCERKKIENMQESGEFLEVKFKYEIESSKYLKELHEKKHEDFNEEYGQYIDITIIGDNNYSGYATINHYSDDYDYEEIFYFMHYFKGKGEAILLFFKNKEKITHIEFSSYNGDSPFILEKFPIPSIPETNKMCSGNCVNINKKSCASGFKRGLCPGPSEIQCCTGEIKDKK